MSLKNKSAELIEANKKLALQNIEIEKRAAELVIANKDLLFQNEEKEKHAAELIIANKELLYQNEEKEKRAAELVIANKELTFQNEEKEKRASELVIANKELAFQNKEKEKRAAELEIADKALVSSENRYRRLFEAAKDGILILNADTGKIVDVNPYLMELLGYSHSDFLGKQLWEISDFKDIVANKESFIKLQQNEYIRYENMPLKSKDGHLIWVEFISNMYDVAGGKIIQCNIRNITDRRKAELLLDEKIEQLKDYKYALDESSIVDIADENGKIIYVNDNFCKITKYSREEIIGQEHRILNSGYHHKEFIKDLWETITQGKVWHNEMMDKAKDGSFFWVDTTIVPFLNNERNPYQYMVIRSDITARKEAEEKLLQSESMLKKAQEIANLGSWRNNLETKVIEWSDEQCRICGVGLNENHQTLESFYSFIHPEDIKQVREIIKNYIISNEDNSYFARIVRKDGTVRNIYVSFRYDVNKEGKPISRYGITHDITDRIKAEEALYLNYSELKKINSELDRFVYSISHELRSPLTSIMGLMNIIDYEKLGGGNDKTISLINRSVYKMDETLREILNYSRNARNEIKSEELDMASIIDSSFENSHYYTIGFAFDKRIKIKADTPFFSDLPRIKVIVNNLISNALKYGKKYIIDSYIEINIVIDNSKMILEISDNGIGIKTEYQSKLFGMFYRATSVSPGTGLGLYIAKECLEKLNGTIEVESEFGKGTKFTVTIPNNNKI